MTSTRELDGPPGTLGLYGRAALGAVPLAGRLPFIAGGGGDIPSEELILTDVAVDPDRLAEYSKVCGFALRDELPPTYPHMLAFPLQMKLMTDPGFPFGAVGLVHIANRITQHRPIGAGEILRVSVRCGPLEPHPKGRTFTLVSEARAGDEIVWSSESQNLRRGGGSEDASKPPELPDPAALPGEAEWRLGGDLGRRYGAVSGDRNPIHMYGLTAKAFGFPRQIAHGMWTKARCLAQLESRLPDRFTVEVGFRKPILLPSTVEFAASGREGDGAIAFGVRSARDSKPHLAGRISPA